MKLPHWLTRQATTSADFAERSEEARRDIATLVEAKRIAQAAYDAEPSAATENALIAADDATRRAQLRLESADRALEAVREREATSARRADEARLTELEASLSNSAVSAAAEPLDEREVSLLLQVASCRAERVKLVDAYSALGVEREQVLTRLGRQGSVGIVIVDGVARTGRPRGFQGKHVILSRTAVVGKLETELQRHQDEPTRQALAELVTELGGDGRIPRRREMHDAESA